MKTCTVCGNDIPNAQTTCQHCGSRQKKVKSPKDSFVTMNLEEGMPLVKEALCKLEAEIGKYKRSGVRVIRCIHGWGSSGTGGEIRKKVIPRLRSKKQNGSIRHYYNYDTSSQSSEDFQKLLSLCPEYAERFKKDKKNKGVSYILL